MSFIIALVAAQTALQPLTPDDVVASALEVYPLMIAARADVDAAGGETTAAEGAFDPSWKTSAAWVPVSGYPQGRLDTFVEAPTPLWGTTFYGGYRYGAGKIQPYYGARETWSGGELRAGAMVPVLRNGPFDRRRANTARAGLAQELARLGVEQQRLELTRMATVRYWEWVAAGKRKAIAQALLDIGLRRDEQLGARAMEGDVAHFDRQDNVRALKQRQAQLAQAQRGVEQAAFELSLFLRDAEGNPAVPAETRLPPLVAPSAFPENGGLEAVLARRPDVLRLEGQLKQAEIEVRLAENQVFPRFDVGVAVSKELGVAPRPELNLLGPTELELTANIDVPILYRAPLGKLQSARAALRRAQAQLRLARDRVSAEVNDGMSALRAARERMQLAAEEIAAAAEVEQGERERFELGESSLVFVNLREQTSGEARLREVDAIIDTHRAVASLRFALAE